uniref:Uncharacterized protein n=1 Tax=Anguilla anguilla TaxID=7936 RepID=A0A0E9T280_ANGAN
MKRQRFQNSELNVCTTGSYRHTFY